MTPDPAARAPIDDDPTTIATFPNPYEAELARVALESQGVPALVLHDHGQYLSAGAWTHLDVARVDGPWAVTLLEEGPPGASVTPEDGEAADDQESLRAERRRTLARWFLYAGALGCLLSGLGLPLSVAALALALWSKRDPRWAFGVACLLQSVVVLLSVATFGPLGLTGLIPLLAFYFAWASAGPRPQPSVPAGPYPRTRSVDIGDSWRTSEALEEPGEWPSWFLRDLSWLLIVIAAVWFLSEALRIG